ncbi:MAG: glutathione S-transferase family protein [Pseudomonadota bacterium]
MNTPNTSKASRTITLFHAPHSRASATVNLLEEIGVPYELRVLNMKAGEQRQATYLKINPLGKVPALLDGHTLVTEQVAIFIHLADRFPQAGLAPSIDDPRRGSYLRWLVYYAACFEPAMVDRMLKREPVPRMQSPYDDFDTMLGVIETQLTTSPYLLGDELSAADLLWGSALGLGLAFGGVPRKPVFEEYAGRLGARPAAQRVAQRDVELAAAQEAVLSASNK